MSALLDIASLSVAFDGKPASAGAGEAVTLVLEDELDITRGDVLAHPDRAPSVSRVFDAHIIWMSDTPLLPGRQYEFKLSHRYMRGTVESITHRVDVNDLSEHPATELKLNEVGLCRIVVSEQAAFDTYGTCRSTGALICSRSGWSCGRCSRAGHHSSAARRACCSRRSAASRRPACRIAHARVYRPTSRR